MPERARPPEESSPDNETVNLWRGEYTVRAYEVDARAQLSVPALCNILQEAAGEHAGQYNISAFDLLRDDNCTWILARLLLHIRHYPGWKEKILVETWPRDIQKLFVLRDFRITGARNELIGSALTAWIIIDAATRRPIRPQRFLDRLHITCSERALNANLIKLPPSRMCGSQRRFVVRFSDIDMNRHVNNVSYIEWALESLPPDVLENSHLSELEINFLAEAALREEILTSAIQTSPDKKEYQHHISKAHNGQELARARTVWR